MSHVRLSLLRVLVPLAVTPLLAGCIGTAANVVTAPVRVAAKGVDLATTSQSEADQKRGREIRKREERLGRLRRDYDRHSAQCRRGDDEACHVAREEYEEIQRLMPMVPLERD